MPITESVKDYSHIDETDKKIKVNTMTATFGTGDISVSNLHDQGNTEKLIGVAIVESNKINPIGIDIEDNLDHISEESKVIELIFEGENALSSLMVVKNYLERLEAQLRNEELGFKI
jgi:hypothetical protein